MDIELSLRQLQVLRDPGVRFTDGVMARLGDAPTAQAMDGVARLADARARRRNRRILIVTLVAIGVAAAMPLMLRDSSDPPMASANPFPVDATLVAAPPPDATIGGVAEEKDVKKDPLACLDPDVLHGLLLQGYSNPTFSIATALPLELTSFKAPPQFTWVGLTRRHPVVSTVQATVIAVYRTTLAPAAALAEGGRALTAVGWQAQPTGYVPPVSIFKSGDARVNGETYCREGQPVSIGAGAIDGVTYVALSVARDQERSGGRNVCDNPPQTVVRRGSSLDQFMPVLEAPRDRETGRPVAVSEGSSSSGSSKRSGTARFMIRDSVGNIAQHFGRQMAEQGWMAEANWTGTVTAGSTWTRRIDADTLLQGTLTVSVFQEDRFTAVFAAVTTK
jgi:hypothetical protein